MFWKRKRIRNQDVLGDARKRPCDQCGGGPCDAAHIRSRGAGGDDSWNNVVALCRSCHRMQHFVGWPRFARLHANIKAELELRGWELIFEGERWRLIQTKS